MKFSIFPNSQILILFFLLRPLARHLMPLLVASMPRASIRNQNVPYRTTRRRQNIHYSLFIQGISRSIYAEGKGSSIIYAAGKIFIIHYSLNFARPLRPFHIVPLKNRSETTSILQQNYNNFCAYHKFVLPLQQNIQKMLNCSF